MPFTLSHPAIILIFGVFPKKHLSWTGLIVGTLAPDFEYFLRMKVQSEYAHTISGLFYFDLPLGILLAFLYHNFVKESLVQNLPQILKSRLLVFDLFDWNTFFQKRYILVCISIVIGAASHILWDSFTHHNAFFVNQISILKTSITLIGLDVPIFKILQHFSTLLGGLFIIFVLLKLPSCQIQNSKISVKYWSVLSVISLIIVFSRFVIDLNSINVGNLIVTFIFSICISLVITPYFYKKTVN
jgi:hypothetical protein